MSETKVPATAGTEIEALRREVEVLIQQACERIQVIDALIARTRKREDVEAGWREKIEGSFASEVRGADVRVTDD